MAGFNVFLFLFCCISVWAQAQVTFITPEGNAPHAIVLNHAISDADTLLLTPRSDWKKVTLRFVLKDVDTIPLGSTVLRDSVFMVHYPDHGYRWAGSYPDYTSTGPSMHGLAFGLYGLMDHVLGFKFIHARQTVYPDSLRWPGTLDYSSLPRFNKKGFHLHTQHPLELTEQLHNPDRPNAWPDVKAYIDWLARNRQNYWEFCLLRTLDMKQWQPHAKRMVDYSHERGIMAGIDLSLHMIQQRTYQLYKNWPKSWRSKETQMERNMARLFYADWDFMNVEFNTAEFVGGKDKLKTRLKKTLIATARNRYGCNIMGRKHVVSEENMVGVQADVFSASDSIDLYRGVGIHTVMMYSLEDSIAPVYENDNFHHIHRDMRKENAVREVWFYPESAYWITYDNSVPMLLMPYLSGRLSDILLCEREGVPNHLTFSSGWEWGYWTVDWSIARWSWKKTVNGKEVAPAPLDWVKEIGLGADVNEILSSQLELQKQSLIAENLLQFLCAQTITDELSLFRKQFHPRPDYTFKWLRNEATDSVVNNIENTNLPQFERFIARSKALNERLAAIHLPLADELQKQLLREYLLGLQVTTERARHRMLTVRAMVAHSKGEEQQMEAMLSEAAAIRLATVPLVREQESMYRYDKEWLFQRRHSFTSYQYGYLMPVHDLHFWNREEQQVKRNRFSPFFMSIWDIGKILGL
ncbi:MAG: hypothetical protein K9J06_07205 [Flavobacteriales bacterium]|nr:hypothetical protein [Flavobacteriales bacterium]